MGAYPSIPERQMVMSQHVTAIHSMARWKSQMDNYKQSNQLIVIDFTATWCGPCRFMETTLNELAETYTDVVFVKIDVDELRVVAQEWGVESLPTFLLVKNGKEVDRIVGAKKDDLKNKIEQHRSNSSRK
ncbi:thioredoxin H2-like protein [Cinnamomum micranthum f. kanehirae]|uniref:Thioredoxin H2-like protein n=1 Tax=Cinnamomum micranthum f. kanehirae TaxID=337451 RepID=A0A443NGM7_9MAGN|nr:thioredoxin H2-like protein [Cinnamomum micranthum f. kanehirae]